RARHHPSTLHPFPTRRSSDLHIARQTPIDPAKLTILQATFDPALLDATGADVIILHREWDDEAGVLEATLHDRFGPPLYEDERLDRKSTRLNSSHVKISYAVF